MDDELRRRLAVALNNCRPQEREFLEACKTEFDLSGTLSEAQTLTLNTIFHREWKRLEKLGVVKSLKEDRPLKPSDIAILRRKTLTSA